MNVATREPGRPVCGDRRRSGLLGGVGLVGLEGELARGHVLTGADRRGLLGHVERVRLGRRVDDRGRRGVPAGGRGLLGHVLGGRLAHDGS